MAYETIHIATDERGVATLTLCRPQKHNTLNSEMISELTEAAVELAQDAAIRIVVLTGEGVSFCAGADLEWMREQFNASRAQRISEARKLAGMLKLLNELPKPLIGRINGQAYGGGLGMISVCDTAIAVEGARFGFTEPRLGLIPATISPYCLARIGEGLARRVFMSGRIFDAAEARSLNLVAQIVENDELEAAIEREIKPYLSCSPLAVAAAKALARRLGPVIDEALVQETATLLADCWETADALEGISAFLEKRKPAYRSVSPER
jgi:methylglutaconyl-CoA hydratase